MTRKKKLALVLALVLLVAIMIGAYALLSQKGRAGLKKLTVSITGVEGVAKNVTMETGSEFLRGALEEYKLISGDEGAYGLFVTTVDGYTADSGRQEWWCITKGGETVMTGVDSTPIADGDSFELTLTTGY